MTDFDAEAAKARFDWGCVTRGFRHPDDFRTHIDRINGPHWFGPPVLPAIVEREALLRETMQRTEAALQGEAVKAASVEAQAEAVDHVDATVKGGAAKQIVTDEAIQGGDCGA